MLRRELDRGARRRHYCGHDGLGATTGGICEAVRQTAFGLPGLPFLVGIWRAERPASTSVIRNRLVTAGFGVVETDAANAGIVQFVTSVFSEQPVGLAVRTAQGVFGQVPSVEAPSLWGIWQRSDHARRVDLSIATSNVFSRGPVNTEPLDQTRWQRQNCAKRAASSSVSPSGMVPEKRLLPDPQVQAVSGWVCRLLRVMSPPTESWSTRSPETARRRWQPE